jgi:hypothetical protein
MRAAVCFIAAGLAAYVAEARRMLHPSPTSGTTNFLLGPRARRLYTGSGGSYRYDDTPTPYGSDGISLQGSCFVVGEESTIAILYLYEHDVDEGYYSSTVSVDWGDESNAEQVVYDFMQQMSTDTEYSIPIIHTYSTVGAFKVTVDVSATAHMLGNGTSWWTVHRSNDSDAVPTRRCHSRASALSCLDWFL